MFLEVVISTSSLSIAIHVCEPRRTADSDVQHREIVATKESYTRLLESLYFPDIHAREEGIDEAHKQTFEWIFDEPGNKVMLWHYFVGWLEEGHGTYWISGKAGSGKSTLMNFICHDPRTEAALKIWSGTDEVFMLNFFFWSPGSQLQKSLAGLLRSLIYQILERTPDVMPILAETGLSQHGLRQLPTWTEQRLRATLQNLVSVGLEKCRLCIFIDGLDEFHGDHVTLLNLISSFREITKVKFCLSSRPYSPFKHELGSSPMLKLQDLTEPDIRRYVSDEIEGAPLKASWVPYSSSWIKEAVDTIVQKAEGVFLWVRLAVRDQFEGIRNGDDPEQLRERLQILPTEIEEVYGHMLHGIDKVYRKEVARYIRLVLDFKEGLSLFEIALAEHKRIDDILLFSEEISFLDMHQHCKSVGERIAATCKGFLEVRERERLEEWQRDDAKWFLNTLDDRNIPLEQREELTKMQFLHRCTRVEFLHRTAFDFFHDSEQGKEFLKIHTIANSHPQVLYVKALLAEIRIVPVATDKSYVQNSITLIMRNASVAEEATGVAQLALMDLINRSITLLWEHSPGQPSNLPWCRVWGKPLYPPLWTHYANIRTKVSRAKNAINRLFPVRRPVDFLGLAAWYGLNKYVQHMLDMQSGRWKSGTADYLLSCSVGGLAVKIHADAPKLELIAALLKRGADPNTRILDGTVWALFLDLLHYHCLFIYEDRWQSSELRTYWSNTVKAFLENGANVHEKIYTDFYSHGSLEGTMYSLIQPLFWWDGYGIERHLSTRSILQWCFAKEPNFFEVEDPLIASGATLYLECTHLICRATKGQVTKWVDLEPSEQQLNQLTNTCEQGLLQESTLERLLTEIFENADMERLFEQAPTDHELENRYEEARSQEDQSDTDIDPPTDSSSIDAPASPTDEAEGSFYSARSSQQEED